ncbi:multicomponent Na+:H+ antiporter subunit E [Paenimyroides aquimaris]|uniref:Multicomponent Na+:H+ antiporter subunit E n=1 Tax=Paenimyroides marinum TaxID=1159016 RepID=A0A1H6J4M1_9FLAO|nr:Na+/H+ antiporter subunit E [Paenimyroides aquimaris]SEH56605.1 multicomponent Na+:H+ antiporter subunit E [Paenimyroides aquimaris]
MLQNFLLNILLTFVWVALTGQLGYTNFVFGYALGFFILWMVNKSVNASTEYFYRVPKIFAFILLFFYDLMKANYEVTKDVITPNYNMKPGIIKYEMEAKTDFEITMLANMIALTPGTVVVDLSKNKKFMYIHVMYLTNKEEFIERLSSRIERKLLEIIR